MIQQQNTVIKVIEWLRQHRAVNMLLVGLYFLFIVFMHHPLVLLSIHVEQLLGIGSYDTAVAVIFVLLLASVAWFIFRNLPKQNDKKGTAYFYGFSTLILMATHAQFMFDSNIEVIHALEFTLLVLLIFPLVNRFSAAICFTLPFMLIDEWYQYILLYPDFNDYFDLNDILMDTYGCGLMMVLLMLLGIKNTTDTPALWKRGEVRWLLLLTGCIIVGVATGIISPYLNDTALLVMNERSIAEPFWRFHIAHNRYYHVMAPAEGFAAIGLLYLFYLGMDCRKSATA